MGDDDDGDGDDVPESFQCENGVVRVCGLDVCVCLNNTSSLGSTLFVCSCIARPQILLCLHLLLLFLFLLACSRGSGPEDPFPYDHFETRHDDDDGEEEEERRAQKK